MPELHSSSRYLSFPILTCTCVFTSLTLHYIPGQLPMVMTGVLVYQLLVEAMLLESEHVALPDPVHICATSDQRWTQCICPCKKQPHVLQRPCKPLPHTLLRVQRYSLILPCSPNTSTVLQSLFPITFAMAPASIQMYRCLRDAPTHLF